METINQNEKRRQQHLEQFDFLQDERPSILRTGILQSIIYIICLSLAVIFFLFFIICLIFGGWKEILNSISPLPQEYPELVDIINYILMAFTFFVFLLTSFIAGLSRKILRRNNYIITLENFIEKILSKEESV